MHPLRNHPKRADFYMTFLLVNFAVKNAMFNLNKNNRFVMAQHPSLSFFVYLCIRLSISCQEIMTHKEIINNSNK